MVTPQTGNDQNMSKWTDIYHNEYATKLVPSNEGDQAVRIRGLNATQRNAIINYSMLIY